MVGKLLAQVSLGVKLVLEVVVVRLDMVAESVFVGIKLVESVFVGIKLVLEAMVVRLDMVVIAAVAVSIGEL